QARRRRLLRPAAMIALRLHEVGDVRLHEEPVRAPGPDEALLRVAAVGLCGSDLHWFAEGGIGDAALERPLVLGHEPVAVVAGGSVRGSIRRSRAGAAARASTATSPSASPSSSPGTGRPTVRCAS